jgi:hypothetical protein
MQHEVKIGNESKIHTIILPPETTELKISSKNIEEPMNLSEATKLQTVTIDNYCNLSALILPSSTNLLAIGNHVQIKGDLDLSRLQGPSIVEICSSCIIGRIITASTTPHINILPPEAGNGTIIYIDAINSPANSINND